MADQLLMLPLRIAAATAQVGEGHLWDVVLAEAGPTLLRDKQGRAIVFPPEMLKRDLAIFDGAPVNWFSIDGQSRHERDEERAANPAGNAKERIGRTVRPRWDPNGGQHKLGQVVAQMEVSDPAARQKLLDALRLKQIGEGVERPIFGLSVDTLALRQAASVDQMVHAEATDLVTRPAAGGRILRLVAAEHPVSHPTDRNKDKHRIKMAEHGLRHANPPLDREPAWADVNKSRLPDSAHADASERSFPHHWVRNGSAPDDKGRFTEGDMHLHRGGLNAAWAAAMGARTGRRASTAIIAHLQVHRRALNLERTAAAEDVDRIENKLERLIASVQEDKMNPLEKLLKRLDDLVASNDPDDRKRILADVRAGLGELGTPAPATSTTPDPVMQALRALLGAPALRAADGDLAQHIAAVRAAADIPEAQETAQDRRIKELEGQLRKQAIQNALKQHAGTFQDLSDVTRFLDLSTLKVGENGEIQGLVEQLDALAEAKPYLLKKAEAPAGEGQPVPETPAAAAPAVAPIVPAPTAAAPAAAEPKPGARGQRVAAGMDGGTGTFDVTKAPSFINLANAGLDGDISALVELEALRKGGAI